MVIKTTETSTIKPFIHNLFLPPGVSHKGQNGRILVIGGSSLFHASPIWSAEVASHFVDGVHFASTIENNEIFTAIKKIFHNGIVVSQKNIPYYVAEDDAILVGPGMVRNENLTEYKMKERSYSEILKIHDEAEFAAAITFYLIHNFPEKKFVFDAGALQMMNPHWLQSLKIPALITPHQLEFERLFGIKLSSRNLDDKIQIVKQTAKQFNVTILLKAVDDIISDGGDHYIIHGGNQGLTKGGTGDLLAGLCTALYSKNNAMIAGVLASFLLKKTADTLEKTLGYWYNNDNLIQTIPATLASLVSEISASES